MAADSEAESLMDSLPTVVEMLEDIGNLEGPSSAPPSDLMAKYGSAAPSAEEQDSSLDIPARDSPVLPTSARATFAHANQLVENLAILESDTERLAGLGQRLDGLSGELRAMIRSASSREATTN